MTVFLIVTLAAPFASFAEEAGNVERGTVERPGRATLLGLAAAALGVDRANDEGQAALGRSFRIATRTVRLGSRVTDFHTFQSLPSAKGRPATRAGALSRRSELETSITRRSYLTDVVFHAAYAAKDNAPIAVAELAAAFARPRFVLSLGRRSCPLAAPLVPREIEAEDAVEAFRTYAGTSGTGGGWLIAAEDEMDLPASKRERRTRLRLDDPVDRRGWLFAQRREWLIVAEAQEGAQDRG